ncbi:MAG: DUF1570 domain-containing protein [Thermoguttaceae bacterium]|jgi:hypothetical protein
MKKTFMFRGFALISTLTLLLVGAAPSAVLHAAETVESENAQATITNRVIVKLKTPIPRDRRPVRFESVFEEEKEPPQRDAAGAAPGLNAVRNAMFPMISELVGREIIDARLSSGKGKYMIEDDFGEIHIVPQSNVDAIEPAPDVTLDELREQYEKRLLDEFGKEFRLKSTEHYIFVSNASESYVDWCSRLFESLEEGFRLYARKNNIELEDPGKPLIVVIFARQTEFIRYAAVETSSPDKLAAYYNMETNRVALYDLSAVEGTAYASGSQRRKGKNTETREILSRPNAEFNVATIVHEATHQIAFNRGLFLRTGPVALWTAEGLSLLFETPNGRVTQGGWSFRGTFPKNTRMLNMFANHIGLMDDPFRMIVAQQDFYKNLEGSYAASWALFYYLYKKRPNDLAQYLRHIASKTPCTVYPPEERVADFEAFFGSDWEKTTNAVIRYIRRL